MITQVRAVVDLVYQQTHNQRYGSSHIVFFFFNDTATTEIYTLSLHDALPILLAAVLAASLSCDVGRERNNATHLSQAIVEDGERSEEHTSELQSLAYLVCRLLLEKKNYQ